MIIGETFYYAGEALAALEVAKATGLPVVLTIAPMAFEEMADGVGIVETCQRLEQAGADVVGMNCFRGPETMLPWLKQIRAAVSCHVGALPIPYRTTAEEPTFFNLSDDRARVPSPHGRTFPTALDPLYANRYEIGAFAKEVHRARRQLPRRLLRRLADAGPPGRGGGRARPPRPAGSPRTCTTTSCTATTSGSPSTSSRSATRPSRHTIRPRPPTARSPRADRLGGRAAHGRSVTRASACRSGRAGPRWASVPGGHVAGG